MELERTGSRIVERLRNLIPLNDVKTTKERDLIFYWPIQIVPSFWRGFRMCRICDMVQSGMARFQSVSIRLDFGRHRISNCKISVC